MKKTKAVQKAQKHQIEKIERSKNYMTRWEDYRKAKKGVVDRYI